LNPDAGGFPLYLTSRAGSPPRYYAALDFEALWRDYPPAPEFFETTWRLPRDQMRALQNERFLTQMKRAWEIPFYQRHWKDAGMQPGDIRSLDDLANIPAFSVHDLRDAIARNPPWGDFIGIDPESDAPMPLAMQTSGGTTGLPRPMIYSPQDREVMNIITGRRLHMQGVRPFDLVQVTLSLGLSNGGFLAREGIWKYTGAVPVMTGSGAQTPTRRQIEIMLAWKTRHLIGFPAYLRHMGHVMRDELNIDPRSVGIRSLIVHLGTDDRASLEELWGADVYDTYGTNECGSLAAECAEKNGMHVFEDAFVLEMIDTETGASVADGERGTIYQTTLFKHLAPLIRFNSNDVSSFKTGTCSCGCGQLRIDRIFGRSDNMIKLRGTNIFPEAIGALVSEARESNGEYVCIVERGSGGQDEMEVKVEVLDPVRDGATLEKNLAERLKTALGVKIKVEAALPGSLDELTGLRANSKVRRLIDNRPKG
jgi:phenylacetate-CoA ligase